MAPIEIRGMTVVVHSLVQGHITLWLVVIELALFGDVPRSPAQP